MMSQAPALLFLQPWATLSLTTIIPSIAPVWPINEASRPNYPLMEKTLMEMILMPAVRILDVSDQKPAGLPDPTLGP